MPDLLVIIAGVFAFLCLLFLAAFIVSIKKRKTMGALRNFTFCFLMLVLSLLFGTISFSIQGYRSFTHEELAATVEIEPLRGQNFIAHLLLADNSEFEYILAGDELYIDAQILKWKSFVNLLGLHTFYELDRVAGRYSDIEKETTKDRTVFAISSEKIIDIFDLRLNYEFLSFLLDAEYGSATFINVRKASKFKIMVSTTGLLIRTE
jgi:hypothetical protein